MSLIGRPEVKEKTLFAADEEGIAIEEALGRGIDIILDLVTAGPRAGSDAGLEVFRATAGRGLHLFNQQARRSRYGAAPTGMDHADDALNRIENEDERAIRRKSHEGNADAMGDERVEALVRAERALIVDERAAGFVDLNAVAKPFGIKPKIGGHLTATGGAGGGLWIGAG